MYTKEKAKGFTIIEVVLVLAIAGLIFLIVFLALPALQRNQRDTQRRSDVGRAIAAIQSAQSNYNGVNPTLDGTFITNYLTTGGSTFTDPSGGAYTFVAGTPADTPTNPATTQPSNPTDGKLFYYSGKTCNNTPRANALSVVAKLEGGGYYCANN